MKLRKNSQKMPVTYAEIKKLYPSHTHRVGRSCFNPKEPQWEEDSGPLGSMAAGLCYVLLGEVTYQFGDQKFHIRQGECKALPGGEYSLFLGEGDIEIVNVWELPFVIPNQSSDYNC